MSAGELLARRTAGSSLVISVTGAVDIVYRLAWVLY